jgi:hypothetical protein
MRRVEAIPDDVDLMRVPRMTLAPLSGESVGIRDKSIGIAKRQSFDNSVEWKKPASSTKRIAQ